VTKPKKLSSDINHLDYIPHAIMDLAHSNKKTAQVDDPSDLITRVDCLRAREPPLSVDLRVLIRSLGSSTRAVFCLSYTTIVKKVDPFGESCPGTHTGRDIGYFYHMAISPRGRMDFSAVYSSLFC
jgi:hypothetical protein